MKTEEPEEFTDRRYQPHEGLGCGCEVCQNIEHGDVPLNGAGMILKGRKQRQREKSE